MRANDRQVGGEHYKKQGKTGEEHWDRVARLGLDYFQAQTTKYVERCWDKNGIQDLKKARHFLDKYIELSEAAGRLGAAELHMVELRVDTSGLRDELERLTKELEGKMGGPAELQWVLKNMLLTPTGKVTILGVEYDCLKGTPYDFTYEGEFGTGIVEWTCRACRHKMKLPAGVLPRAYHLTCEATEPGTTLQVQGSETPHTYTHKGELRCVTCDQLAVGLACMRADCPHKPPAA